MPKLKKQSNICIFELSSGFTLVWVGAGGPGSLASCPHSPGAQYRGSRLHGQLGLSLCTLLSPLVLLSVLIPPQFSPLSLDSSISALDFLHFGLSSHFRLCLRLPYPTLSSSLLLCFLFVCVCLVTFLLLHLALCPLLIQRPSLYYLTGICNIDQLSQKSICIQN